MQDFLLSKTVQQHTNGRSEDADGQLLGGGSDQLLGDGLREAVRVGPTLDQSEMRTTCLITIAKDSSFFYGID